MLPLKVNSEQRNFFSLDEGDTMNFEMKLDSDYSKIEFDFKLDFGNVDFKVVENIQDLNDKGLISYTKGQQNRFDVKDKLKHQKENDIVLFNTIYLRVVAKKFSKFSF